MDLKHFYDESFVPTKDYLDNLPDMSNGEIIGANTPIEKVGIANFKLPVKIKKKDGGYYDIDINVTGTVSLDADKKGINMSRILRTFYNYKDETFDINKLGDILNSYKKDLVTFEAQIQMSFNYRIWQNALRSINNKGEKEGGWQYYKVTLEGILNREGEFKKLIHFDFVYSSACPCSTELAIHAGETRGIYGIPHSQRSVMRITIQSDELIWIEDLHDMCQNALKTETLVFCKRVDEQAFAELNGANVKFVEDATRIMFDVLNKDVRIKDFKIVTSHNESLHSFNAIAVITKGVKGGLTDEVTNVELNSMVY